MRIGELVDLVVEIVRLSGIAKGELIPYQYLRFGECYRVGNHDSKVQTTNPAATN